MMIAVNAVKQMEEIETRAAAGLQAYGSGEDSAILVTTLISCLAGIYIQIHEADLNETEKIVAFDHLVQELKEDRTRNINAYFQFPLP